MTGDATRLYIGSLDLEAAGNDPVAWLHSDAWWNSDATASTRVEGVQWLLAHSDDGVNWGRLDGNKWRFSSEVFPNISPQLVSSRLQSMRIFGESAEILFWRDGDTWRSRCLSQASPVWELTAPAVWEDVEIMDENHLLWGTVREDTRDGFHLLNDGVEGLRHAPPVINVDTNSGFQRMAVKVRHYVQFDDMGQAYVAASRLIDLVVVNQKVAVKQKAGE